MMPAITTIPNENGRAPAESATVEFCPYHEDFHDDDIHVCGAKFNPR